MKEKLKKLKYVSIEDIIGIIDNLKSKRRRANQNFEVTVILEEERNTEYLFTDKKRNHNKQRKLEATTVELKEHIEKLKDRLLDGFKDMEAVHVNGDLDQRFPGNLNISFAYVEGESLMMSLSGLAVSSGSACTSASLEPSYVLRAIGLSDELAHSSIRFSIGRFTTEADIDAVIESVRAAVEKLRELSPLWEMYKDGVDLDKVEWTAH